MCKTIVRGLALVLALLCSSSAMAATFSITIKNTSNSAWNAGLLTLQPLIVIGNSPRPPTQQYATYEFLNSDSTCTGSCTNCLGNTAWLAGQWGLTIGTNAWVVPALAVNASTTVTFTATPSQNVSYIAKVATGTDDFVAIHVSGNIGNLAAPLFDGAGFPLGPVVFDIAGYDLNSTSSTDGNAASCSPACVPPASGCFVASGNGTVGGQFTSQPPQPNTAAPIKFTATGYRTDAIALGDVTGTATNELVVVLNSAVMANTGRALVLTRAMTQLSTYDAPVGHDMLGLPLIEDLDLNGKGEYVVGEFFPGTPMPGGKVFARYGPSTTGPWTSSGWGYSGMWNMGSSAGDVRTDAANPGNEVVVGDYDGDLLVLKRDTGVTLNTYDTFTTLGDHLYGHVAIADLNAAPGNEIIVYGADTGRIHMFNAPTAGGALTKLWTSAALPAGQSVVASGPAIGDIDGDGRAEIVVAVTGAGAVYAFDPVFGTGCKYKWSATGGADYAFSSPVIGDVTGTTKKEVVVFSSDGILSILTTNASVAGTCVESTVLNRYTVGNGGPAWFTPALANLTGSASLDVVVANYNTFEVFDVAAGQIAYRYSDAGANFYPSAVIERGAAGAAGASIYVSGWLNGVVYRFDTPVNAPVPAADWPTFMGSNTRVGSR